MHLQVSTNADGSRSIPDPVCQPFTLPVLPGSGARKHLVLISTPTVAEVWLIAARAADGAGNRWPAASQQQPTKLASSRLLQLGRWQAAAILQVKHPLGQSVATGQTRS